MKKLTVILLILALSLGVLTGCGDIVIGHAPTPAPASETPAHDAIDAVRDDGPKGAAITLTGSGASFEGGGVSVSGSTVTIASPGSYTVSGTLDDGCIVVNTGEVKGDVTLTLAGADITCLSGPAIHVIQAKNFDLVLERDTQNRLVSGSEETADGLKHDGAVLFCEDDLDILGSGSLEIVAYLNNGITCKDDLDIKDGTISVTAVYNGIKGSESVEIYGGSISVRAGNDGVKATSAQKEGKGFVTIEGGTLEILCDGDGISAETALTVSGGEVRVRTSGDVVGRSCKALKAKTALVVTGGTIELDSEDHAIHSAGDMQLTGGALTISSRGGKGVSSHGTLEIGACTLDVVSADDGIEAEEAIVISDGVIRLLAGADGLKAGSKSGTGAGTLTISGGSVTLSAMSDPFDAKGGAVITGGSFNGVGSPKTPKGFSSGSTQRSLLFRFSGAENTAAEVWNASGELVGAIEARCGYTCAIFSRPELAPGSYTLKLGTLSASADA
jgi:hypothetical protein